MTTDEGDSPPMQQMLEPDEQVHLQAQATDASMIVTDRRVAVAINDRVAMAVPFEGLRRVQYDIERDRLATLVLVPERPTDPPQVLLIPPDQHRVVGEALGLIAERLAAPSTQTYTLGSQAKAKEAQDA